MPPKGSKIARFDRESSVDHTPEWEAFNKTLTEYHEKRGTTFEPEPKVGLRHIHLLDLYNRVIEEGGYDLVSDTKAKPLMWRKIAEECIGKSPHLAAQAFQVKSAYYRNLAAYEISEHWKEDPPPKEILEDLTAKGGGIRGRTLESYERPGLRETSRPGGDESDSDGDTKTADAMEVDESTMTGRSSRGLRQAPPQRVLFQPDLGPPRQSRATNAQNASPSPSFNAGNAINQLSHPQLTSTNTTLASYEPRSQLPLTLKPVTTPANNPDYFRLKRKQIDDATVPAHVKRFKSILLPGSGFIGPNIYSRAQLALQSGLPEEERYALHHLVKISHERGDKYRFDQFPGLAELLIQKVLQTSGLFYNVKWDVKYNVVDTERHNVLDGIRGTLDIVDRMRSTISLDATDSMQDHDYHRELNTISEAALILRNMVMLDENAIHIAKMAPVRDMACVVLSLDSPSLTELQFYVLEIVEQLSVHLMIDSNHPLYKVLLEHISGTDRGKIITALRATARLGMRARENKRLEAVPPQVLSDICDWLLVEDEDLRCACLDFLYQFTSTSDNIDALIRAVDVPSLVGRLAKLLLFDAKRLEYINKSQRAAKQAEGEPEQVHVPRLATGLIENLLSYEEPERSSHWLKMCFVDDPNAEMTQIELWKSYQGTFGAYATTRPHLIAGDFIKNVSNTFHGASAQVAGQNKYVIRGIKPRRMPLDYKGRELLQCHWRADQPDAADPTAAVFAQSNPGECGQWFPSKESVLEHILGTHLKIPRRRPTPAEVQQGVDMKKSTLSLFDYSAASMDRKPACAWSTCQHDSAAGTASSMLQWALLARHADTHLPETGVAGPRADAEKKDPRPAASHHWLNTGSDACGLPLGAALCLRNVARGLARMADEGEQVEALLRLLPAAAHDVGEEEEEEEEVVVVVLLDTELAEGDDGDEGAEEAAPNTPSTKQLLIRSIFGSIRDRLFFTMGHNNVLRDHVADILRHLARSGAF